MSRQNMICDYEKINKSSFYKNKKLFNIYDIDVKKTLGSKKDLMVKKAHSNTLLGVMIMMILNRYV